MAIPLVIVLGLVCTFYIYVAVRWWRVAKVASQEVRRESAMVRLSANAPSHGSGIVPLWETRARSINSGMQQPSYGNRSVIVMNRARAGK
jgi:hypothetical protein